MTTDAAPLRGVRVLDLGWSWAGPYAAMILADLGAEIIKLESATRIDILRWSGAFVDNLRDYNRSGYYMACNRGKHSFALNLKHPDAPEIVRSLVSKCDVLIENFAPRVMDSLGLGAGRLLELNPRLVMLSMSGYGAYGPERDYVSYGDHLLHASGIAALTGDPADPHTKIGIFYGDTIGGMYGALGIIAALAERDRTGHGRHIQLSQLHGLVSMIPTSLMRVSLGQQVTRAADGVTEMCPYGMFRCAGEDAWVAIAVRDDDAWQRLAAIMAADGVDVSQAITLEDRQQQAEAINAAVGRWTEARSPWQITHACQAAAIAAYPVQNAPRLLWDEHLAARGFFVNVHHPIAGPGPIPGVTFRVGAGGAAVRGPAPVLGQHNAYVYQDVLGLPSDAVDRMVAEGVIA